MMTKESADGPDVIQGDDFSWTPAAWQGGMAYVDLMRTEGSASGSVGRIWCARARWGGQERWLVYARDGQIALRPTESGSTRLSVVGRGLAFPEDGTYLTAECVYQTPEMPSPSPLSAELLQFRDEAVKYWARYQENASGQLTGALTRRSTVSTHPGRPEHQPGGVGQPVPGGTWPGHQRVPGAMAVPAGGWPSAAAAGRSAVFATISPG